MFNIDIAAIVLRNTVYELRKPIYLAYTRALLRPLKTIEGWFDELRDDIAEEYRFNGKLFSMTKLLNERYDPVLERIYMTRKDKLPIWYYNNESDLPDWYWKDEAAQMDWYWLDEETFNTQSLTQYEFTVYIHVEIVFNASEMMRLLEIYRFAGFRPRLVTYGGGFEETELDPDFFPG